MPLMFYILVDVLVIPKISLDWGYFEHYMNIIQLFKLQVY